MADTLELPVQGAEARAVALAVNQCIRGKTNNSGRLTLNAGVGSTTISTKLCGTTSKVILFPESANAAAELGAGTIYISAYNSGSFVVTHANNAQTDRTYGWVLVG